MLPLQGVVASLFVMTEGHIYHSLAGNAVGFYLQCHSALYTQAVGIGLMLCCPCRAFLHGVAEPLSVMAVDHIYHSPAGIALGFYLQCHSALYTHAVGIGLMLCCPCRAFFCGAAVPLFVMAVGHIYHSPAGIALGFYLRCHSAL